MKSISALFSIGQLAKKLGVHVTTVRRWCKEGKLQETTRTIGNHRRFSADSFSHLIGRDFSEKIVLGYARVSSHDQKKDLQTQKAVLENSGCNEVITDLGSGLNCKKPGLLKLLNLIWSGAVRELKLTHGDRLLRFGKELIFYWCRLFDVKVTILEEEETISFETELVRDVITLMTVFSARLYGKRSRKNQKKTSRQAINGIRETTSGLTASDSSN